MNLREQFFSSGTLLSWVVAVKQEQSLLRMSLLLVQVAQPARESVEHLRKCKAFNIAAWCKQPLASHVLTPVLKDQQQN